MLHGADGGSAVTGTLHLGEQGLRLLGARHALIVV
jgi:hypothetical protein